jgi:hypothetical protein
VPLFKKNMGLIHAFVDFDVRYVLIVLVMVVISLMTWPVQLMNVFGPYKEYLKYYCELQVITL